MRRPTSLTFSLVLALAALGCNGREGARDAGDGARGLVRIDVSYTHGAGAALADARFDAQARFVRYRAFESASVPTILGFVDFESLPVDSCRVVSGAAELDEALTADTIAPAAEVLLLDAGRVEVRGGADERAQIAPRHYPELVPFVSGVVYLGDEASPLPLALGQSYQVVGEGGTEVGPFTATVTAPRSFPLLTSGQSALAYARGSDLELRWATEPAPTTEPLLVEIKWTSRQATRSVRCRVRDDGAFAVPHDAFNGMPAAALTATVTATRLARAPVFAPGVGRGELTLGLKDVAALQVSP